MFGLLIFCSNFSKKFFMLLIMFVLAFSYAITVTANNETEGSSLIIINKAVNKLAFYQKGELIKTFDVATGRKKDYTPEGTFNIINKVKNRPYYKEKIPGGSSQNPLGDRWMGLDVPGTWGNTYAIHGNNNENSIGTYASAGCVRMHNEEIRWLFDRVSLNSKVVIVSSKQSFEQLALESGYELKVRETKEKKAIVEIKKTSQLFNEPSRYTPSPIKLTPQIVEAFEISGSYYHIKSWFGSGWIHESTLEIIEKTDGINKTEKIEMEGPIPRNQLSLSKHGLKYTD